jgi:hypothetical protein
MRAKQFSNLFLLLPLLLLLSCSQTSNNPASTDSHPPSILPLIPQLSTAPDSTLTLDLSVYEYDAVTPCCQLVWTLAGLDSELATASIDDSTKILTIVPAPAKVGMDSFALALRDENGDEDRQDVFLTIGGVIYPASDEFVVFTWNTLGMHCLNPTYDSLVILPPYNDLHAQVIKRGNPPEIVTAGLWLEYSVINNTDSYGKRDYGQFWDNCLALFGVTIPQNTGLNLTDPAIHNGLGGYMLAKSDHFEADGIPVTPVNDDNVWDPYQVADVKVRNAAGTIVAETHTTIPTSDEIDCAHCHGSAAFTDILQKHDQLHGTTLMGETPVLCASCHASPALGNTIEGPDGFLSKVIHGSHAPRNATCYDCHPGAQTQCSRSMAHTAPDGNCITCHGDMYNVANTIIAGRIPWVEEPKCVTCHAGVPEVDTGTALYRNATGHNGLSCTACHSSPHAMIPSSEAADNYQAFQYQRVAKTISSCGACHESSKGPEGEIGEFPEVHGGTNPEHPSACNICHTATPFNTALWPHAYLWHARP